MFLITWPVGPSPSARKDRHPDPDVGEECFKEKINKNIINALRPIPQRFKTSTKRRKSTKAEPKSYHNPKINAYFTPTKKKNNVV